MFANRTNLGSPQVSVKDRYSHSLQEFNTQKNDILVTVIIILARVSLENTIHAFTKAVCDKKRTNIVSNESKEATEMYVLLIKAMSP